MNTALTATITLQQLTLRDLSPDGGAVVGVIVTEGVIVRFGRLVRGGRAFEERDDEEEDDDVAAAMLMLAVDDPAVRVAPPGKEERGGGSIVVLLVFERCEGEEAAVDDVELLLVEPRLLVALSEFKEC